MNVAQMRRELRDQWLNKNYIEGRGGATVEVLGASFLADEESIFGEVNAGYVERELEWYRSQSLNLGTFPGGAPKVWEVCASYGGFVNSNYGWCLYSEENGSQLHHVTEELKRNPSSRRATAIYTRPSMHVDATRDGMQDFMCTNAVEYFVRQSALHCVVQMRSSDAVLGYRNDRAWHLHVLQELAAELSVAVGAIHWQAGSLHVYQRHFTYLELPYDCARRG
jgi:thymidylate synthase